MYELLSYIERIKKRSLVVILNSCFVIGLRSALFVSVTPRLVRKAKSKSFHDDVRTLMLLSWSSSDFGSSYSV